MKSEQYFVRAAAAASSQQAVIIVECKMPSNFVFGKWTYKLKVGRQEHYKRIDSRKTVKRYVCYCDLTQEFYDLLRSVGFLQKCAVHVPAVLLVFTVLQI